MFVEIIFLGLRCVSLQTVHVLLAGFYLPVLSVRYKIVDFIRVVVNFAFILTDVKLVSCHF